MNEALERLVTSVPGPRSAALRSRLGAHESRNVTFLSDGFGIFWESAMGATVTDVDGNRYIDCAAAFGVANAGHCNPSVIRALARQAELLIHGMGDVHPTEIRVRLYERLARILPEPLDRAFLASTGSEAIEAALKTAILYTGRSRFAAYRGGYHGLSFGALSVAGIDRFRRPFAAALGEPPLLLEYPGRSEDIKGSAARTERELDSAGAIAALVVEPIAGRGGVILPPDGYLRELRRICDERGIVMIVDEIFTGFGRTGTWFAVERDGIVPDLLCIGKALGSGFPISAAIGRRQIMDAWPESRGEALHTSTYLGSPLGCAAAIATIDEIERLALVERARELGDAFEPRFQKLRDIPNVVEVRGRGLLWGVALRDAFLTEEAVARGLRAGAIFLQSGSAGDVITVAPPLVISEGQLNRALDILARAIERSGQS